MPFTPFHFGPAALLKAAVPRSFSFAAFAGSQVVIDLESGYHLFRNEWPVHRVAHTLPVAILIGVLTGTIVWLAGRWLRPSDEPALRAEVQPLPAHVGGFAGGLTHPLLDGIMHSDVRPFWPITDANPLLGALELDTLHLFCFATGVLGVAVFALRMMMARA